jgi:hypothetical protein
MEVSYKGEVVTDMVVALSSTLGREWEILAETQSVMYLSTGRWLLVCKVVPAIPGIAETHEETSGVDKILGRHIPEIREMRIRIDMLRMERCYRGRWMHCVHICNNKKSIFSRW